MAESTTIYTPDNGGVNATLPWLTMLSQRSGIDANTLLAMANGGGFGGFGGNMGFFWLFFMFMWMQNGGWNGNQQDLANMIYNREGRDYLMQAIQGNRDAVNNLAGMLNTNIASIQTLLNSVNMGIQQVGNQVGMSGLQVINAIQAGNCELGNKFANCCCETRSLIQQQGYENRLATLQQTDALAARIDAQTTMINDKFCALEMRELQNKLDASRLENTQLRGEISQGQQNAYITGFVGQALAPINAQLAALNKEVDDIKCKQPNTVSVPYPNLVAMNQGTALNLLANAGYGFGYAGNFGGNGFFGQV